MTPWGSLLELVRPGDWLVLALGAVVCAALVPIALPHGAPEKAVIKRDGAVVAEVPLTKRQRIDVPGPLGITSIEIEPGRARVASDPGPRQLCVRQGWLTQADALALCLPNHVSLAVVGRNAAYDSLAY